MDKLTLSISSNKNLIIETFHDNKTVKYEFKERKEIIKFVKTIQYSQINKKSVQEIKNQIKQIKRIFQPQCLSTFGGPGLGKSTTALNVTAALKMKSVDADYIPEVAKDIVYSGNLDILKDQAKIMGLQIDKLKNQINSTDVSVTVQDSPFILGIAYQSKDDPYVEEEDFVEYYVKQYLNYTNLNILLKREEEGIFQDSGRIQNLEESKQLDKVIQEDILNHNGLSYIQLPAYEASKYMVELGITMDKLSIEEMYNVYNSSKDQRQRSKNYHILVLSKTIKRLKSNKTQEEQLASKLKMKPEEVISVLKEQKELNNKKYVTQKEMVLLLQNELKEIKK